jgi:predicted kinase
MTEDYRMPPRLIVVTGLPATGKTTLARELASRLRVPLLAKDAIKEPLLSTLGASDRAQSRRLSDASFAVLFTMAHELAAAGIDAIIEGNFRPG